MDGLTHCSCSQRQGRIVLQLTIMAIATGSQIRPELSAVDYTPFLQASGQAAQMQARGAENIAAGLANLGQQVASGVEKYYKKQEEKK